MDNQSNVDAVVSAYAALRDGKLPPHDHIEARRLIADQVAKSDQAQQAYDADHVRALAHAYVLWRRADWGEHNQSLVKFFQRAQMFGDFTGEMLMAAEILAERELLSYRPTDRDTVLGTFDVTSTILRISDPCYEVDTWCAGQIDDVIPGKWEARTRYRDDWGRRPFFLAAFHESVDQRDIPTTKVEASSRGFEMLDIDVGVDSGQAGIFDSAHYNDASVAEGHPSYFDDDGDRRWYGLSCLVTLGEFNAGVIPFGAVSSSGMGDGSYTAFALRRDGKVVGVVIDFTGDLTSEDDSE